MKQIGNLAIVCARRSDVQMEIRNRTVSVLVGTIAPKEAWFADWDDDAAITALIHELNFGRYKEQKEAV